MAVANGKKAHVLAVPYPVQGHVRPLMKLCRQISNLGRIKVTFVNTQFIHDKINLAASSSSSSSSSDDDNFVLTSIPDGLPPDNDRRNNFKLLSSLRITMVDYLTDLIEKINGDDDDEKISCIIADTSVGWILEVAHKMGAQAVGFVAGSAASTALIHQIPNLTQQGFLDLDGSIKGSNSIILSHDIPHWKKNELAWSSPINLKAQKNVFQWFTSCGKIANDIKWLLCNTSYELESSACDLIPNLVPIIGPSLETTTNSSSLYNEDASCISWLNNKPNASVIYISFGSLAIFSQVQIAELALGLELSGRPFLWVVRSDLANGSRVKYPNGFLERSSTVGKIVEWAPQEKVLSHPSVACFLSHCGWNSTLEGLNNGVPFLCWPYEVDQFHNRNYICDKWNNGLRIEADNGVKTRHEIKNKIDLLFSEYHTLKENALGLKATMAKSVRQGGFSFRNLQKFIDHLKVGRVPKILSKF